MLCLQDNYDMTNISSLLKATLLLNVMVCYLKLALNSIPIFHEILKNTLICVIYGRAFQHVHHYQVVWGHDKNGSIECVVKFLCRCCDLYITFKTICFCFSNSGV